MNEGKKIRLISNFIVIILKGKMIISFVIQSYILN